MDCLKTERFVHHKTGEEENLRLKNRVKKRMKKVEKAQEIYVQNTCRLNLRRMRGRKVDKDNSPESPSTDENHQDTNSGSESDHIKLLVTTHQRKAKDSRRKRQQLQEATKGQWIR